jgi:hypothetical protein
MATFPKFSSCISRSVAPKEEVEAVSMLDRPPSASSDEASGGRHRLFLLSLRMCQQQKQPDPISPSFEVTWVLDSIVAQEFLGRKCPMGTPTAEQRELYKKVRESAVAEGFAEVACKESATGELVPFDEWPSSSLTPELYVRLTQDGLHADAQIEPEDSSLLPLARADTDLSGLSTGSTLTSAETDLVGPPQACRRCRAGPTCWHLSNGTCTFLHTRKEAAAFGIVYDRHDH